MNSLNRKAHLKRRFLRLTEVMERTGLSRTTIWRLERKKEFPTRRKLSTNIVGWLESEIEEWFNKKITEVL